mmetsp:Transcript_50861/g.132203  ORF Transcript_50861/g.132203 Transcript_50861/m.132203 type:complete len:120 (-) Transcript_50861:263-622(-)
MWGCVCGALRGRYVAALYRFVGDSIKFVELEGDASAEEAKSGVTPREARASPREVHTHLRPSVLCELLSADPRGSLKACASQHAAGSSSDTRSVVCCTQFCGAECQECEDRDVWTSSPT